MQTQLTVSGTRRLDFSITRGTHTIFLEVDWGKISFFWLSYQVHSKAENNIQESNEHSSSRLEVKAAEFAASGRT